jgi:hypothetical protein
MDYILLFLLNGNLLKLNMLPVCWQLYAAKCSISYKKQTHEGTGKLGRSQV